MQLTNLHRSSGAALQTSRPSGSTEQKRSEEAEPRYLNKKIIRMMKWFRSDCASNSQNSKFEIVFSTFRAQSLWKANEQERVPLAGDRLASSKLLQIVRNDRPSLQTPIRIRSSAWISKSSFILNLSSNQKSSQSAFSAPFQARERHPIGERPHNRHRWEPLNDRHLWQCWSDRICLANWLFHRSIKILKNQDIFWNAEASDCSDQIFSVPRAKSKLLKPSYSKMATFAFTGRLPVEAVQF